MKLLLDARIIVEPSYRFWFSLFIKHKCMSLSCNVVKQANKQTKQQLADTLTSLKKKLSSHNITVNEIAQICKELRFVGIEGIMLYAYPLISLYHYILSTNLTYLSQINEEYIYEFFHINTAGFSDSTTLNWRTVIISFFRYIEENCEGGYTQFRSIKLRNITRRYSRNKKSYNMFIVNNDLKDLLVYVNTMPSVTLTQIRDRLLLKILIHTGIRTCEAILIQTNSFTFFDNGYVSIRILGKNRKERLLYVKSSIIEFEFNLYNEARKRHTAKSFFVTNKGMALSQQVIYKIVSRSLSKIDISSVKKGAHILRHTFATKLYNKEKDIILVQEALGHSNISTTKAYIHTSHEDLIKVAHCFDDLCLSS